MRHVPPKLLNLARHPRLRRLAARARPRHGPRRGDGYIDSCAIALLHVLVSTVAVPPVIIIFFGVPGPATVVLPVHPATPIIFLVVPRRVIVVPRCSSIMVVAVITVPLSPKVPVVIVVLRARVVSHEVVVPVLAAHVIMIVMVSTLLRVRVIVLAVVVIIPVRHDGCRVEALAELRVIDASHRLTSLATPSGSSQKLFILLFGGRCYLAEL